MKNKIINIENILPAVGSFSMSYVELVHRLVRRLMLEVEMTGEPIARSPGSRRRQNQRIKRKDGEAEEEEEEDGERRRRDL